MNERIKCMNMEVLCILFNTFVLVYLYFFNKKSFKKLNSISLFILCIYTEFKRLPSNNLILAKYSILSLHKKPEKFTCLYF